MNHKLLALFVSTLALLSACSTTQRRGADASADYVLVYLKTGPQSGQKTKEESATIFSGHMENMRRLAHEHVLLIAGPFDHPHDASWRGIFVLDVASLDRARALVATDPGVQAQVFTPELVSMKASPALRRSFDLERAFEEAHAAEQSTSPTSNIRGYAMITARDAARAERALDPLRATKQVLWQGRLGGEHAGEAVFVLDASTLDEARTLLGGRLDELGEHAIDSWWSTKSLEGLAAPE